MVKSMYYIYIDESYNLTSGSPNQLIVLGGFGTSEPKRIAKAYRKIRKIALKPRQFAMEIKSFDRVAVEELIPKVFKTLVGLDVVIYVIRQDKKFIPFKYFQKDKLNYERLYLDLLIRLLRDEWNLEKHSQVSVMLDTFPTKAISQEDMSQEALHALKRKYPKKNFGIQFADSTSDFNLQVADFVVGSFFRSLTGSKNMPDFKLEGLRLRIIANIL